MNFQTKNAMMPIKATPPATDIPTIEPVLRPELSSGVAVGPADSVDEEVADPVIVTVTSTPLLVVSWTGSEVVGSGGWEVVEVVDVVEVVLVVVDDSVVEEEEEVEDSE